jgi:hypothetical protein
MYCLLFYLTFVTNLLIGTCSLYIKFVRRDLKDSHLFVCIFIDLQETSPSYQKHWFVRNVLQTESDEINNQQYALNCITPLFDILAPTCFGSSLPS